MSLIPRINKHIKCDCLQEDCPNCNPPQKIERVFAFKKGTIEGESYPSNDELNKLVNPVNPVNSLWKEFFHMVWLGCKEIFKV